MTSFIPVSAPRALLLCSLALAASCALPPRATDELPGRVETVDDRVATAADRNRQERENQEVAAYRAEQKRREEEAEARRHAEAEAVQVTRLDDLRKQKEAEEARARAEAAERDRAAAGARQKVARARKGAGGKAAAAPVDPAARLAQRRADPRWTRPGLSGLLCAARADRDRAAGVLSAETKRGKKADPGRLADAQKRVEQAEVRARRARAELDKLGLRPLGCKDQRTAEAAACYRTVAAGKPCKRGQGYVEVASSFTE